MYYIKQTFFLLVLKNINIYIMKQLLLIWE